MFIFFFFYFLKKIFFFSFSLPDFVFQDKPECCKSYPTSNPAPFKGVTKEVEAEDLQEMVASFKPPAPISLPLGRPPDSSSTPSSQPPRSSPTPGNVLSNQPPPPTANRAFSPLPLRPPRNKPRTANHSPTPGGKFFFLKR